MRLITKGAGRPGFMFLYLLQYEIRQLVKGVAALDGITNKRFTLRGGIACIGAEMMAMKKMMNWVGPNGHRGCRCTGYTADMCISPIVNLHQDSQAGRAGTNVTGTESSDADKTGEKEEEKMLIFH